MPDNVGRSPANNNGLILQTKKPEEDENEIGLIQATLLFNLPNNKRRALNPARGTLCSAFTSGNDTTRDILADLNYLGKQTGRFIRNGQAKGIGTLELICQGAIFTQDGPDDSDDDPDAATWTDPITKPFASTTTTRETTAFAIYNSSADKLTVKAATTANVVGDYFVDGSGHSVMIGGPPGSLVIDGVVLNYLDRILIKDQTDAIQNGVYYVHSLGDVVEDVPWELIRLEEMDEDAEVVDTLFVQVAAGTQAHTVWQCTSDFSVTGAIGTDDIVFAQAMETSPGYVSAGELTIDYHTIDLHFEYVAKFRAQAPRFIKDDYAIDGDGMILIDPANNIRQQLRILSALITGGTGVTENLWRSQVKYVGDAGRFDQIPAGPYWHVLETAQIKILPILPNTSEVP